MIRILLPKPLDHMTERENKKYASALKAICVALNSGDSVTAQALLKKNDLKILGEPCEK